LPSQWESGLFGIPCRIGGPVSLISALSAHAFITLYPVNPATATRYRQVLKPAARKATRAMPKSVSSSCGSTATSLPLLLLDDPQTRQLGRLLEQRRGAVDLRTLVANMLRDALAGLGGCGGTDDLDYYLRV
jgi:hypothetical protein